MSAAASEPKKRLFFGSRSLGRMWFPFLVFIAFLAALLSHEELVLRFLGNASIVARNTFVYGVQIGLWISAAFLVQRGVTVFFWEIYCYA